MRGRRGGGGGQFSFHDFTAGEITSALRTLGFEKIPKRVSKANLVSFMGSLNIPPQVLANALSQARDQRLSRQAKRRGRGEGRGRSGESWPFTPGQLRTVLNLIGVGGTSEWPKKQLIETLRVMKLEPIDVQRVLDEAQPEFPDATERGRKKKRRPSGWSEAPFSYPSQGARGGRHGGRKGRPPRSRAERDFYDGYDSDDDDSDDEWEVYYDSDDDSDDEFDSVFAGRSFKGPPPRNGRRNRPRRNRGRQSHQYSYRDYQQETEWMRRAALDDEEDDFAYYHLDEESWEEEMQEWEEEEERRRQERQARQYYDDPGSHFRSYEANPPPGSFAEDYAGARSRAASGDRSSAWGLGGQGSRPRSAPARAAAPTTSPEEAMQRAMREKWNADRLSRNQAAMLLGVAARSAADEVQKAKRQSVLRWHPDKNQGDADAAEKFRLVMAAADILS